MAFFPWRKKKKSEATDEADAGLSSASLPAIPQTVKPADEAWERLLELIDNHPLFQLTTFDGLYWIDPFNGEYISAPFDLHDTIRDYFSHQDHWRQGKTKSAVQLYAQRWLRWYEEDGANDARLHQFNDAGLWFDPSTKQTCSHITQSLLERPAHFAKRISYELAQQSQATPFTIATIEDIEIALGRRAKPIQEHNDLTQQTQTNSGISTVTTGSPAVSQEHTGAPASTTKSEQDETIISADEVNFNSGQLSEIVASEDNHSHNRDAHELIAAAINDIKKQHHISDAVMEDRLFEQLRRQGEEEPSTEALLHAVAALRDTLEKGQTAQPGPSNAELYESIISLRDDMQSAPGHSASKVPVINQSELNPAMVEQLVNWLRGINLVAAHLDKEQNAKQTQQVDEAEPESESGSEPEYDEFGRRTTADESEQDEDLEKAQDIQGHLLGGIPALTGIDIALHYQPYTAIGGDFYQVIALDDDRCFFIIGDVSGHGVQAALIVSSIVNSLKIIMRRAEALTLADIMCDLNDYMRECLPSGKFFTAFAGILDTSSTNGAELECVCAGHHPTICLNASEREPIREIGKLGMGIGIVRSELFRKQVKPEVYQLVSGDTLAIYTDGITETMDENGEELGEVLVSCSFFAHLATEPASLIDAVLHDIAEESDGVINDDETIMVMRIH